MLLHPKKWVKNWFMKLESLKFDFLLGFRKNNPLKGQFESITMVFP